MTEASLQKTIFLKADKATVWSYLVESEKLGQWFHKPKQDLTQDAEYSLYGRDSGKQLCWGKVEQADPYDLLRYTFTVAMAEQVEMLVEWTLTAVAGGTRLTLQHTGLPQGEDGFGLVLGLDAGWDGHFGELRAALAKL